jgi:hypothetical protein
MQPAQSLVEAAKFLKQEALDYGSPLYADLRAARATKELTKLEVFLSNAAATPNAFAKAAFIGNRGSGKSTYLLHLEHDLQQKRLFTPLHVYLDASLESDCDYSDLFLWIVDEIARQFKERGHPVKDAELAKVATWFAEKSLVHSTNWRKEIGIETEASAFAKGGLPGILSFKILARLKSMIVGSETSRKTMRQNVQNYGRDLLDLVNGFLDHSREVLRAARKPERLLIVQDNLDRLRGGAPVRVFDHGGHMLTGIRADIIYTAPLALNLAPFDLRSTFFHTFTMPNAKVRLRNGKPHKPGIDGLIALIGKRLDVKCVFAKESVARFLVEKSGGSVRDLIRLLDDAQLEAQVDGKTRVDHASAKAAVRKLSLNFTRVLLPGVIYYPILAGIHQTKRDLSVPQKAVKSDTAAEARDARQFFAELIGNGTVLEYNGDDSWYDVHPAVCETEQFKDACQPASKAKS